MDHPNALNQDFNISTARATTVHELASLVWSHFETGEPQFFSETPYEYDVQKRVPDVSKARDLLGFEAQVTLEDSVDEVCKWVAQATKAGLF